MITRTKAQLCSKHNAGLYKVCPDISFYKLVRIVLKLRTRKNKFLLKN